jgi:UDP-N-acetylglucosamine 2-epimerase (non-hydrolysing)
LKIAVVLGTRPEAIKLVSVVRRFLEPPYPFDVRVIVTAQHRGLLDQTLAAFSLKPDYDLDVMRPGQTLAESTSRMMAGLDPVLAAETPDMVVVQGDTTTTLCGAMAAFYRGIPVAHVEAGLRTGDLTAPFPEEMNRVLATRLSTLHFAPTMAAAANLEREGVSSSKVFVTGNTGMDAVLETRAALGDGRLRSQGLPALDPRKKLILVTAHRRESFAVNSSHGLDGIWRALVRLARREDVQIVYPVHPNPSVRHAAQRNYETNPGIALIEPLDYVSFVDLMCRSHILLTDSGGIQEEGPSLGKPVLVMRDKTERPEAIAAGTARLVGTDPDRIVREAERLLDDSEEYARRSRIHNPYGDGRASTRIRDAVRAYLTTGYGSQDQASAAATL